MLLESRILTVTVGAGAGAERVMPLPVMDGVAVGITTVIWAPVTTIGDGAVGLGTAERGTPGSVTDVLDDPTVLVVNGRQVQSFAAYLGGEVLVAAPQLVMRARNDSGSSGTLTVSVLFRRVEIGRMEWVALRNRQMPL